MNNLDIIPINFTKEKDTFDNCHMFLNRLRCLDLAYTNYIDKTDDSSIDEEDDKVDINTEEKETVKDIQKYQDYQENQQNTQPWASSQSVRIVDTDDLPDPLPIVDTGGCPKCGNIQAHWWIVQTDSADEPSTQFFRCTVCNHTWRTPKTS